MSGINRGAIETVIHCATVVTMNSTPITRQKAAEILGVSVRTISNHIRAGVLPPPQSLGGRRVYWKSDVFWAAVNDRLEPTLRQKSPPTLARATENRRGPGRPRKSAKL